MKVKKNAQVKEHTRSQKWKDVKGKRCRIPVASSELNSTPVMIKMIKEHQILVKKKPKVKRLKKKAKVAAEARKSAPTEPRKAQAQTNGSSAPAVESGSDDVEEWREYSQSVQCNRTQTPSVPDEVRSGRLEGESLHRCAERDDRKNHAVLVMQKDQVLLLFVCLCCCSGGS